MVYLILLGSVGAVTSVLVKLHRDAEKACFCWNTDSLYMIELLHLYDKTYTLFGRKEGKKVRKEKIKERKEVFLFLFGMKIENRGKDRDYV